MICTECEGTGKIEKLDRNGFIEVDCPFCYESLGEIDAEAYALFENLQQTKEWATEIHNITLSAMVRLSRHRLKNAEKNFAKHPSEDNWNKLVALRRERKDFEMRIQEQKCPFWL